MAQSNNRSNAQNILYLFDKPCQPIFRPKGSNSNVSFDVPASFYTDRYKPIKDQVQVRGPGDEIIPVKEITPPNMAVAMTLDKKANFSVFSPLHIQCATNLIECFLNASNIDDFISTCVYAQQRVNPYLYIYALSVAVLHRNDTKGIPLPSHMCSFPELYVDSTVLTELRRVGTVISDGNREPVEIPRNLTASDLDVEHRLAYFREDIGINLHHWHWHLIYPSDGPATIMNKDRRGELFYWMHQQIIARYNIERFCNNLGRVRQFNFYEPIPEGYFPKLDTITASRVWPGRQANTMLQDVNRELDQVFGRVEDLVRWKDRIHEAISRGSVLTGTDFVPLRESDGIDILGSLIEASSLSINRNYYGNFHNTGHNMLSFIHDPDNRFLETFSTIGDNTTSLRDPVFFPWHNTINEIFDEYKRTLTPYTEQQLRFEGVEVTGVEVTTDNQNTRNMLQTFWERNQVDLSRGVDFMPRGPVFAAFTHIQHAPFTYHINVRNSGAQRVGTVRIFIAPKMDERGLTFRFRDQRGFFIELDRFTTTLRAGNNTIQRRSADSTLTAPFEQTFRNLEPPALTSDSQAQDFVFCGCGWPDHALLPKGTADGYQCELFVMITDYQQDRVDGTSFDNTTVGGCDNAFLFCGVRNGRYPDRRAMGFPFDRLPRAGVVTLSQFRTPNMAIQDVRIFSTNPDKVVNGKTFNQQSTTNAQTGQTNQNNRPGSNQTQTNQNVRPGSNQPQTNQNTRPSSNQPQTNQNIRPGSNQSQQNTNQGTRPNTTNRQGGRS